MKPFLLSYFHEKHQKLRKVTMVEINPHEVQLYEVFVILYRYVYFHF